jgi:uncharacterized membrane protein
MNIYIKGGIIAGALLLAAYAFYQTNIAKKWKKPIVDGNSSWLQYIIYYNPDDPRTLVPKRIGIGVTLNFARPVAKVFAVIIFFAIILSILSIK